MAKRDQKVTIRLTKQQHDLANIRRKSENLSWQFLVGSALNDYILGKWHPTDNNPGEMTVDEFRENAKVWGKDNVDPDDGLTLVPDENNQLVYPKKKDVWGFPEFKEHITKVVGKEYDNVILYDFLRNHSKRTKKNSRYKWIGGAKNVEIQRLSQIARDGGIKEVVHRRFQTYQGEESKEPTEFYMDLDAEGITKNPKNDEDLIF